MTTQFVDANGNRLTIRRGTSPTHTFTVKNPDGTAKNLTGATEVTFAIGSDRYALTRDLILTLADGVTHDDTGGVVSVPFTDAQTEALPHGTRWAELWITDNAGKRDLVGEGETDIIDTMINLAA